MLAYLFFHRPSSEVDTRAYEDGLRRFHAALAGAGVAGFKGSRTYRVGGAYCDWYLVETSGALDQLNDAAVSGARSPAHDAVAHQARDFAGKLLKLTAGDHDPGASFEIRFSKPRGLSYPELYRRLEPWTQRRGVSVWRRMLVLGPPPEFCMLAGTHEKLPPDLEPEVFPLEAI